MTQQEIVNYLKKHYSGSIKDIADYYGLNKSSVSIGIKKMYKYGELVIVSNVGNYPSSFIYKLHEDY